MKLSISDLVYINDAAKSLKHRDFVFFNNTIIGLDNLQVYICKVELDVHKLSCIPMVPLIMNQKELTKFIKALSTESSFDIDENLYVNKLYSSIGAEELNIIIDHKISGFALSRLRETRYFDDNMLDPVDVTNELNTLFELRKTDGAFYYIHEGKYYMTLFSGLLPLNKSDKVFVSVLDKGPTFLSRFIVKKAKFQIVIYIAYVTIPKQ